MVLAQNSHVDHWNEIEDPEISQFRYTYLILDKASENFGGKTACSTNDAGKTVHL
jgi:hypothetical protein